MSISAECPDCGGKFQAPDKLAGKRVKCPKCSAVIQVGGGRSQPAEETASAAAPTPHIPVACGCGKKFRAKSELAGKRVKCPACGQALAIPSLEAAAAARPKDELDQDQLTATAAGTPALLKGPVGQAEKTAGQKQAMNVRLLVGLGAGAGAIALVVLLVVLLWPSNGEKELAEKSTPPGEKPPGAVDPPPPSPPPPLRPAGPRTYPSFPGAVTEAPAWLTADAPFDVAKFLEVPPAEENAALLYLDALFEFSTELAFVFSPEEQRRREPIVRQRDQEFGRLYVAWEKDPAAVDQFALNASLAQYGTGFQKLALAQQRPRCAFQTGYYVHSLLGHAQGSRQVARVVMCRNWFDLKEGDFERPIEGLETVLRLSRDLRPRGAILSQLISVVLDGWCYQQIVPAILTAPEIETEHCDRLLAALARHEAEAIEPFLTGLRAEYLMGRVFLHDLEHHTGQFNPGVPRGRQLLDWIAMIDAPDPETLDAKTLEEKAKQAEQLIAQQDFQKQLNLLDRFYRCAAQLPGATIRQRQEALADLEQIGQEAARNKDLIALMLPALSFFSEAIVRHQTYHRGAKCLIALHRWQLENETSPPDIAAVVKAAGMDEVPIDPYSDEPLRMTTAEGRPVIYSVGKDGKDDKGLLEWKGDYKETEGDLIFRLKPPP